ncbi:polysaccharide deacetylase family protein [Dongia sp.]|uniref:polysaccharide deacetylase family protein n=1 Tax=Dongia sp. TaxID=1977262 RepID=UPI00375099C9
MTGWGDLARECEIWGAAGRTATWWWRDDDAVAATPALDRLLEVARGPIGLAVIPAGLHGDLAPRLRQSPAALVLQHGYQHRNHAPEGGRKSEFPDERDAQAVARDLSDGFRKLSAAFGGQFLPVLTPPWNRIGGRSVAILQSIGFIGLTRYQPRTTRVVHGLNQVNTHVDVIDWRGKNGPSGGFLGEDACLSLFIGHLQARRQGQADRDEPTGVLSHHLVHDPATWRFLEKLRDFLANQAAARLLDPSAAFREDNSQTGKLSGSNA